jgi:sugar phosphate isomerase/epimerase
VHASAEPILDEERAARSAEARRSIRTLAEMAGSAGCRIAVELLPRSCLGNSAQELLALLEGVDPQTAGVCLDTNHLMADFAALPDAVRVLGPRLIALHCSDYDGVDEKHWPPMRGVIDWPAFLAALQDVGFPGPLTYEATLDGETPDEKLAFLEDNYARLVDGAGLLRNP